MSGQSGSTLFPYTSLFRSDLLAVGGCFTNTHVDDDLFDPRHFHVVGVVELSLQLGAYDVVVLLLQPGRHGGAHRSMTSPDRLDRKSTRLNSSHSQISYAVF